MQAEQQPTARPTDKNLKPLVQFKHLTDRKKAVYYLLMQGMGKSQIARVFGVSPPAITLIANELKGMPSLNDLKLKEQEGQLPETIFTFKDKKAASKRIMTLARGNKVSHMGNHPTAGVVLEANKYIINPNHKGGEGVVLKVNNALFVQLKQQGEVNPFENMKNVTNTGGRGAPPSQADG